MKLNLRAVDLNLLPIFVAVVEAGKLSLAADRLGMSQPAVSAALQRLRLTVQAPLFTRSRSGLSPTPRALELYTAVSTHLQNVAQALDPAHCFDPATSERAFQLLAPDFLEFLVLGHLMRNLREVSAHISVRMQPQQEDWQRQLLDGKADFAIDSQLPGDDRLEAEVVMEETLAVVARLDHPRIQGSLSLEAFLAAEHVVLPARERQVLPLDQILGKPGWRRRVGAQVVSYGNLLPVAAGSDLIATVPLRMAQVLAPTLGLQVLPFPVAVPAIPVYLLWPRALQQDPAHRWFCDLLRRQLAEL
ncbi:LysR family transcriptional regulator [Ketobacter sp.]|uniref:LysR family transcriptional regulator n=1 Tax=Ketobacter sp. TaxID=2083498 RepID=UPI000F16AF63|nr:LysR family transcriptional regulator [Ketobacter sp.]RLT99229.1 MAG: LysR family transcriptional regulator [Ketobacter sp.]